MDREKEIDRMVEIARDATEKEMLCWTILAHIAHAPVVVHDMNRHNDQMKEYGDGSPRMVKIERERFDNKEAARRWIENKAWRAGMAALLDAKDTREGDSTGEDHEILPDMAEIHRLVYLITQQYLGCGGRLTETEQIRAMDSLAKEACALIEPFLANR